MSYLMFWAWSIVLSCFVIISLLVLGIIVLIVAKLMHKEKIADIATCFILWTIFPFILPFKAKKKELISKQIYSWILVVLAPIFICIYIFVGVLYYENRPAPYEDLLFTSQQEIAAITEIDNFPEFEYIENIKDRFMGETTVYYKFIDSLAIENITKTIELKLQDEDNIFWHDENFCTRGWHTSYTKAPKGFEDDSTAYIVSVNVFPSGFSVYYKWCGAWDLDYYSNSDSLSVLTSVDFPDYEIVDLYYYDDTIDPFWDAKLKLNKKPSQAFIQSLKTSKHWTKEDDGTYHFRATDRGGVDLWEKITVDPNSKFINLHVSTH